MAASAPFVLTPTLLLFSLKGRDPSAFFAQAFGPFVLSRRRWAARGRTHLCQVVDGKDFQQDMDASAVLLADPSGAPIRLDKASRAPSIINAGKGRSGPFPCFGWERALRPFPP